MTMNELSSPRNIKKSHSFYGISVTKFSGLSTWLGKMYTPAFLVKYITSPKQAACFEEHSGSYVLV